MRRFGLLVPLYAVIPFGLGVAAFWVLVVLFSVFRFANCPEWVSLSSTPVNTTRIAGYYKDVVYLQMQDETLFCNSQNGWRKCPPPIYEWDQEEAPAWLLEHFKLIPDSSVLIRQETRFTTLDEVRYYALLDNGQLLQCPTSLKAEIQKIIDSGEILWLGVIVGLIIFFGGWFLKILIEEGTPVLWDWFGRGKVIK